MNKKVIYRKKAVQLPDGRCKYECDLTPDEIESREKWLASFGTPLDKPTIEEPKTIENGSLPDKSDLKWCNTCAWGDKHNRCKGRVDTDVQLWQSQNRGGAFSARTIDDIKSSCPGWKARGDGFKWCNTCAWGNRYNLCTGVKGMVGDLTGIVMWRRENRNRDGVWNVFARTIDDIKSSCPGWRARGEKR